MTERKKKTAVAEAPPKQQSKATRAASKRALLRVCKRAADGEERLMLSVRSDGANSSRREPIHGMDDPEMELRLLDAFGTTSPEFVDAMSSMLLTTFSSPNDRRATREMNAALAVLDGAKPENEVEAMLLTQMVAANDAAMKCLAQISATSMHAETYGSLAVKLMRTYTAQAEALAKLRRRGEQVVRVVHVHPGGQAVVGDVHHHPAAGGGGQISKTEGQSDATENFGGQPPLLGPDASGNTLPGAGRRRKAAV